MGPPQVTHLVTVYEAPAVCWGHLGATGASVSAGRRLALSQGPSVLPLVTRKSQVLCPLGGLFQDRRGSPLPRVAPSFLPWSQHTSVRSKASHTHLPVPHPERKRGEEDAQAVGHVTLLLTRQSQPLAAPRHVVPVTESFQPRGAPRFHTLSLQLGLRGRAAPRVPAGSWCSPQAHAGPARGEPACHTCTSPFSRAAARRVPFPAHPVEPHSA